MTAARRQAGRAIATAWVGRAVGPLSIAAGNQQFPGTPALRSLSTDTVSPAHGCVLDGFAVRDPDLLIRLGGYAGALRADGVAPGGGPDPDYQRALPLRAADDPPMAELVQLVRRRLDCDAHAFYALVFALQERGALDADEVRRLLLRARFRRRR